MEGGEVDFEDVAEERGESVIYFGFSGWGFLRSVVALSLSCCDWLAGDGGVGGSRGGASEGRSAAGRLRTTWGDFLSSSIFWTLASVSSFQALSFDFLFSALTVLV